MIHRESDHVMLIVFDARAGAKLLDNERKRHPVHAQAHGLLEGDPGGLWTEDPERLCSTLKRPRPEKSRDAEEVIGVKVSHEYVPDREARAVTHHLALRSLSTIKEERVPLSLEGDRSSVAAYCRSRRGGAEECDSNHFSSRCCGGCHPQSGYQPQSGLKPQKSSVQLAGSEEPKLDPERPPRLQKATLIEDRVVGQVGN